jgi:hypothetical protein
MSEEARRHETGPSHLWFENAVIALTTLFGLLIMAGSLQVGIGWDVDGPMAGFFPFYVSLSIVVASSVNLYQANTGGAKRGLFSTWEQLRRVLSVLVPSVSYVAFVPFLGMYVSSALLIATFMIWLGGYRVWQAVSVAVLVPVLAYVVFERYFQIALPKGPLEFWLGL